MNQPLIDLCHEIAKKAHKGQKRFNDKDYYQEHLVTVANNSQKEAEQWFKVKSKSGHDHDSDFITNVICTALLHDILEDTDTTADDLKSQGVSEVIIRAVLLLTKNKGELYHDYLTDILESQNKVAYIVKYCDMQHNMSDLDMTKYMNKVRYEKYALAIKLMKMYCRFHTCDQVRNWKFEVRNF